MSPRFGHPDCGVSFIQGIVLKGVTHNLPCFQSGTEIASTTEETRAYGFLRAITLCLLEGQI